VVKVGDERFRKVALEWIERGMSNISKFGKIGHIKLEAETVTYPQPGSLFRVSSSPFGGLGEELDATKGSIILFERSLVMEAFGREIYRVKPFVRFKVFKGSLDEEELQKKFMDTMEVRFVVESFDSHGNREFRVVQNCGDSQMAERYDGSFWFDRRDSVVPNMFGGKFGIDIRGELPGEPDIDSYEMTWGAGLYFRPIMLPGEIDMKEMRDGKWLKLPIDDCPYEWSISSDGNSGLVAKCPELGIALLAMNEAVLRKKIRAEISKGLRVDMSSGGEPSKS
jgi:hypothetical protein